MPTYNGIWLGTLTLLILSAFHAEAKAKATPPTPDIISPFQAGSTFKEGGSLKQRSHHTKRSAPISIPIHKRSSSRATKRAVDVVEIARAVLERDAWRMRNFMGPSFHEAGGDESTAAGKEKDKRAGWETLPMSSYHGDALYYASVQFGTPPQTIDMLLDTGSTDLWVASSTCRTCNQSLVMPYYDGSNSSFVLADSSTFLTSSRTARLAYADGSEVSGTIVRDTIGLGSYTVPNQTFILATQESVNFGIAGILGLAFPSLSRTNSTPWWLNVLDQFEQPEMSFFLTEWNNPNQGRDVVAPGGQFTLGGRNSSLYDGPVQFIPITSERWWTVPILSMSLSTNTSTSPLATLNFTNPTTQIDQTAVIDTGTTLFYAPQSIITPFYAAIPGAVLASTIAPGLEGYYAIPCSSTVNTRIRFGADVEMIFPATNLMWLSLEAYRPGYCVTAFVSTTSLASFNKRFIGPNPAPGNRPFGPDGDDSDEDANSFIPESQPSFLAGAAWMKSVYTVFRRGNGTAADPPSVGFAPIRGVNYQADGNAIIGVDGNGVYGGIGNAGGEVIRGGVPPTQTPTVGGSNIGAAQTDSAGTVYVTVSKAMRSPEGPRRGLIGLVVGVVAGLVCAVW